MDMKRIINIFILVLVSSPCLGSAGDIVHQDSNAPRRPGCDDNFVLVKVPTWVDGVEDTEYVGVGARFGLTLEAKEKDASNNRLVLVDPPDCCSRPKNQGLQTCVVALLSCFRWFQHAGDSFIKVPFFGAASYLTLAVCPFCIAFSVVWAVYRRISFAWIGQDILWWLVVIGVERMVSQCLLVAFSLRYDWLMKKNYRSGYFVWAMTAYGLGLLIKYVALNLMDGHGQPALLYIVPFTLGNLVDLGKKER